MQAHAIGFIDEGVETVLDNMSQKAGVNAVLPTANYILEYLNHPLPWLAPIREFSHNPRRKEYLSEGGLYFEPKMEYYEKTEIKPVRTPEDDLKSVDILEEIVKASSDRGLRVIPWVQMLKDTLLTRKYPEISQVDLLGRRNYTGWMCPNNPLVKQYVLALLRNIVESYDIDGIFIDRFRYPTLYSGTMEWAFPDLKVPEANITCFCTHCLKKMKEADLDLKAIKTALLRYPDILNYVELKKTDGLSLIENIFDIPDVLKWLEFRNQTIVEFVRDIYSYVKTIKPKIEVALDMIKSEYSFLFGQSYRKLAIYCDWIKNMAYYDEPEKIRRQVLNVKELTRHQTKIYPGIGIWATLKPETVRSSVRQVLETGVDGLILCWDYNLAPFENMESAREAIEISTQTR